MKSVLFFSVLCLSMTIWAADPVAKEMEAVSRSQRQAGIENRLLPKKSTLTVGLQSGNFEYEEFGVMSEKGTLQGFTARGVLPFSSNQTQLFGEAGIANVTSTYYGKTWGGTPLQLESENQISNYRVLLGHNVLISESVLLTPAYGYGFRKLVNPKSNYPGSYRREITYRYIPLQVAFQKSLNEKFSFGFVAELDLFLSGTVKTNLSDASPRLRDIETNQGSGSGIRLALPFQYTFQNSTALALRPFIEKWEVEDSDKAEIGPGVYAYEPKNQTTTIGADLSFTF